MRILHVGSGFRPWRRGGLVAYVEDLLRAQAERGDEVAYFFSGRQYPGVRRPWLRRWSRADVPYYELVNSPLYDHGRQPALELAEPRAERMFEEVVDEFRPDVVHVQELAGLPTSLLDVADRLGLATVVTLQDYFFVCPAFKLLDAEGRVCVRREIGADCVATTAADPVRPEALVEATLVYDIARLPLVERLDAGWRDPRVRRAVQRAGARVLRAPRARGDAAAFQRRRDVNVERLSRAGRVIAMSERVAELHVALGVDPERVRTLQLTLAHIERLRPREFTPGPRVTFATVGAFESAAKGGRLLIDAVRLLSQTPAAGRFRVLALGWTAPEFQGAVAELDAVEAGASFGPRHLDRLLDPVDVGLMPSVWEEAYGYAGVEFLAKGIPVLANAIGGMTDYVREGETGWLNRSCSAEELARIMGDIVERPEEIARLNAALRAARDTIVKPIARHAEEMAAVYDEARFRRAWGFDPPPPWSGGAGYEVLLEEIARHGVDRVPGDVLEIGALLGGGTAMLCGWFARRAPDKRVIAVDVFDPSFDPTTTTEGWSMPELYTTAIGDRSQREAFDEVTRGCANLTVVAGDSTAVEIPAERLAFALVDGSHVADHARADFETVWRRLAPGGVAAFHDYGGNLPDLTGVLDECVERHAGEIERVWTRDPTLLFIQRGR